MSDLAWMAAPVEVLQFTCTAALCGLIWYVQWVHYPAFRFVHPEHWTAFHKRHTSMTGALVAPLMLGEAAAAALLLWIDPAWRSGGVVWTAHGLLAVIWFSTAFVQVPLHHRLEKGPDRAAMDRLVATNSVRTAAWTGRLLCLLAVGD